MEPLRLIKKFENQTAIVEFNNNIANVTYLSHKDYSRMVKPLNVMTCIEKTPNEMIEMLKRLGYTVLVNPPKDMPRVCAICGAEIKYKTSEICKVCSDNLDAMRVSESKALEYVNPNYITCPACNGNSYMCETCMGTGKVANV